MNDESGFLMLHMTLFLSRMVPRKRSIRLLFTSPWMQRNLKQDMRGRKCNRDGPEACD